MHAERIGRDERQSPQHHVPERRATRVSRSTIGDHRGPVGADISSWVDDGRATRIRRGVDTGRWSRTGPADPEPVAAETGDVIRRAWRPGGGGTIYTTSKPFQRAFNAAVPLMTRIPNEADTIVRIDTSYQVCGRRDEYVRIDMQGFAENGASYNIQCQAGNRSMAGVICPIGLSLAEIQRGLLLAIEGNCMYTWYPDEDQGGGGKSGGGKSGGGGGKGGGGKKPPKGGGTGGGSRQGRGVKT